MRLTSRGFLKTCLQYETGTDLRELLRSPEIRQEDLRKAVEGTIRNKPAEHCFGAETVEHREEKDHVTDWRVRGLWQPDELR